MSIKTIGKAVQSNSAGLQKRINKSAEKLVFDVLQSSQYSTPIPSTVRELVTNACDSQREKEIALEILSGEKNVEDYYIKRDDDQYKDSNFNPEYYDPKYLCRDNNRVVITYKENDGTGYCDVFSVVDYGVGIGDSRLEGYLELGFSTKRNTAENFGAFGLGAKVPLSTGVDFYTVETAHNGKLFKMNCFAYKTDFLVGKFQADGQIALSDGTAVNYINVNSKNFTKISFGVKRHNRTKFIDAVQDQLNYIDNVDVKYIYEDGHEMDRSVRSDVLYNSDNLIVSDTWAWRRPHIVMVKSPGATTGINYGYVDFKELEMESLWGAVGIKCPARQAYLDEDGNEIVIQDGVEVTPSREKVIWNEHTKNYIQAAIERASQDAADVISEQLNESDFLTWIKKCSEVIYKNTGNDSVLRQLSEMLDKENIKPKFGDTGIVFASPQGILKGYKVRNVSRVWKNGNYQIEREEVGWGQVNWDNLYFVQGNPSASKDLYLMQEGTLTLITEHQPTNIYNDPKAQAKIDALNLHRVANWELFKDSPVVKFDYDEIEVPEDFASSLEKKEQEEGLKGRYRLMSPEERRSFANEVVLYTLRRPYAGDEKWCNSISDWTWDKVEAPLQLIQNTDIETYYGTSEDEAMLKLAATICAPTVPSWQDVYPSLSMYHPFSNTDARVANENPAFTEFKPHRFRNDYNGEWMSGVDGPASKVTDIQLFKVSATLSKKLAGTNAKHISEFFSVLHENKWSMHSKVREWVTGCMLPEVPNWFEKLREVDPKYKDVMVKLQPYDRYRYHSRYWDNSDDEYKEIIDLMKKMHKLQTFMLDGHDEEAIAQKSMELFKVADADCTIAEDDIHILGEYLNEFLEPLYPLFDRINFPYHHHDDDDAKFWKEIRVYLEMKNRHNFEPPL
jgi:hypothetical protein